MYHTREIRLGRSSSAQAFQSQFWPQGLAYRPHISLPGFPSWLSTCFHTRIKVDCALRILSLKVIWLFQDSWVLQSSLQWDPAKQILGKPKLTFLQPELHPTASLTHSSLDLKLYQFMSLLSTLPLTTIAPSSSWLLLRSRFSRLPP